MVETIKDYPYKCVIYWFSPLDSGNSEIGCESVGRVLSIEVSSRKNLRSINISDHPDGVFLEVDLGDIQRASLIEDLLLQVIGSNGIIRFELTRNELEQILQSNRLSGQAPRWGA